MCALILLFRNLQYSARGGEKSQRQSWTIHLNRETIRYAIEIQKNGPNQSAGPVYQLLLWLRASLSVCFSLFARLPVTLFENILSHKIWIRSHVRVLYYHKKKVKEREKNTACEQWTSFMYLEVRSQNPQRCVAYYCAVVNICQNRSSTFFTLHNFLFLISVLELLPDYSAELTTKQAAFVLHQNYFLLFTSFTVIHVMVWSMLL